MRNPGIKLSSFQNILYSSGFAGHGSMGRGTVAAKVDFAERV
jgi:hypothetical protein